MAHYTTEGVRVTTTRRECPIGYRVIPWTTSRRVTLKCSGERVTRRTLLLTEDILPIYGTRGLGTLTKNDAGRTLVVDFSDDGPTVDVLA